MRYNLCGCFRGSNVRNGVQKSMLDSLDFKKVLNVVPRAVCVASAVRNEDGRIGDCIVEYVNEQFLIFSHNIISTGMRFSSVKEFLPQDMALFEVFEEVIRTGYKVTKTFLSARSNRWLQLTVVGLEEDAVVGFIEDVTQEKRLEQTVQRQDVRNMTLTEELSLTRTEMRTKLDSIQTLNNQLHFAAFHDSLTNLFNRAWFNRVIANVKNHGVASTATSCNNKNVENVEIRNFGLLLIDIDNLKNVNDAGGHNAGDMVLRQMAGILRGYENERITAFRFEGDEFILVVKNVSSRDEMSLLGYKIIQDANSHEIGFSGGISLYPEDSPDPINMLKFADMAKSDVKKNGKNNIYFFKQVMEDRFLRKMLIENKLNNAMEKNLFQLYYQPQFDVSSGELRGFEALLRWHDDELGWISPDQFIPLAEESRQVVPLGQWVMDTAMDNLAHWEKDFGFEGIVSVNVSPVQLKCVDFIDKLREGIERTGINPGHLEVEITEGIFIDNVQDTVRKLNQVRDMGIGVSLDDFGTGYSALRYLQILPLTTLKIDKSFISNIDEKGCVEANITESIVSMVSKMGLDTIAEGVENDSQLDMLKKINCHNVQGFLKGKPMPTDLCDRMLSGDSSAILTVNNVTPESV